VRTKRTLRRATHREPKNHVPHTGARADNTLQVAMLSHRGACQTECVLSAPLGAPRTASRVRGSGRRRRTGVRLLFVGDDNTFEGGLDLEIIYYGRLGDLGFTRLCGASGPILRY